MVTFFACLLRCRNSFSCHGATPVAPTSPFQLSTTERQFLQPKGTQYGVWANHSETKSPGAICVIPNPKVIMSYRTRLLSFIFTGPSFHTKGPKSRIVTGKIAVPDVSNIFQTPGFHSRPLKSLETACEFTGPFPLKPHPPEARSTTTPLTFHDFE